MSDYESPIETQPDPIVDAPEVAEKPVKKKREGVKMSDNEVASHEDDGTHA